MHVLTGSINSAVSNLSKAEEWPQKHDGSLKKSALNK